MLKVGKKLVVCIVILLCALAHCSAQSIAAKTNLLGWAAAGTANLGLEFGMGRKVTTQLFGAINPWSLPNERRMRFWAVQPEVRYWFCQKFSGHFVGVHALGGEYNLRNITLPLKTLPELPDGYHYEGWYLGGGLTYGYQWILSRHWNFEASLGLGYAYTRYRMCKDCIPKEQQTRNYVGPTKAALSLIYDF